MSVRFIIVCQARTGSTMLSTALANHSEICAHGEVLNLRNDNRLEFVGLDYNNPSPIISYLKSLRNADPAKYIHNYVLHSGQLNAVGFKFKYEELSNPLFEAAKKYVLRNTDIKIIHMKRLNLWQRYYSEYIALNVTKQFNSKSELIVPPVVIEINPKKVETAFEKSKNWMHIYENQFKKHDTISVTYEQFANDPNSAFKEVTRFLRVSDHEFAPATKKIRPTLPVEQAISNFTEIKEYFDGTQYEQYFTTI